MTRNEFIAKDGKTISYVVWDNVENPVCVMQIAHGMAEHALRYDSFAEEMNKLGVIVFADDHRAHGITDLHNLGYSDGDIWENTLSDMRELLLIFKEKYNLPTILFGHSYGSFLSQEFIKRNNELLVGAIIGGSNYLKGAAVTFGKLIAKIGCKCKGGKQKAVLLKKVTFDAYNKKFKEGTFISSKVDECKRYEQDEACNFICSYNFYKCFFVGASKLYKKGDFNLKDFPILLIAGKDDPVGNMGKGVLKLEKFYRENKAKVKTVLYDNARHEYLNDVSRQNAIYEIYTFVDNLCKS